MCMQNAHPAKFHRGELTIGRISDGRAGESEPRSLLSGNYEIFLTDHTVFYDRDFGVHALVRAYVILSSRLSRCSQRVALPSSYMLCRLSKYLANVLFVIDRQMRRTTDRQRREFRRRAARTRSKTRFSRAARRLQRY